jgi:hypothetical protein
MSTSLPGASRRFSFSPWWLVALALVALRLPHLRGPLTDPHAWRQCDTVHTALDFYRRGFDLFHPRVDWLGGHRTLLLNFPLSEAMSAGLYRIFGPDPMWDRVVSLFFCLLATVYAGATARYLAGERAGRLATLAYLAIPLSQYFSRVPHIEFAVIAFVNGTFYHAMRAFEEKSNRQAAFGALCGILAGLVKGPYLATVGLPLLAIYLHKPTPGRIVRGLLPVVFALVAFELWRRHVDHVNATVPDWTFLPDFYKEVNPIWRYVGTWEERRTIGYWIKIAHRLYYELFTPIGLLIAAGTFWRKPGRDVAAGKTTLNASTIVLLWFANCIVHVLVFFHLNAWHNYYQMPFIAPVALLLALGADWFWAKLPRVAGVPLGAVAFAGFLAMAIWVPSRVGYDQVDWLRIEAGKVIEARVPATDLMIAADYSTLPPTDPRLLFRADREGWPMRSFEINADRVNRLRAWGARWVVVLTDPEHPATTSPAFLESARVATLPVRHEGRELGTVNVFDLRLPYAGRQEVSR